MARGSQPSLTCHIRASWSQIRASWCHIRAHGAAAGLGRRLSGGRGRETGLPEGAAGPVDSSLASNSGGRGRVAGCHIRVGLGGRFTSRSSEGMRHDGCSAFKSNRTTCHIRARGRHEAIDEAY
eukprot:1123406-Prymnesium_polylepis.2